MVFYGYSGCVDVDVGNIAQSRVGSFLLVQEWFFFQEGDPGSRPCTPNKRDASYLRHNQHTPLSTAAQIISSNKHST